MPTALPDRKTGQRRWLRRPSPDWRWIGLGIGLPVATLGVAFLLPRALVLPAMSLLLVTVGLSIAAITGFGHKKERSHIASAFDIACLLVFLGFAASILVDPDEMLRALEIGANEGAAAAVLW